jgi:hypothetical protein
MDGPLVWQHSVPVFNRDHDLRLNMQDAEISLLSL